MDARVTDDNHDLIWGAAKIAAFLNLTAAQTYYLLEHGMLPAKKVGGRWCASKRALLRALVGEVA